MLFNKPNNVRKEPKYSEFNKGPNDYVQISSIEENNEIFKMQVKDYSLKNDTKTVYDSPDFVDEFRLNTKNRLLQFS